MSELKIVSGGQTGVDRGALDAALELGAPCGGWCPGGRLAEDGRVPSRYPVRELPGAGYIERTRQNVLDSDGTLVICFGELEGGTRATVNFCVEHGKPHLVIDGSRLTPLQAAELARQFVARHGIAVLNVAGPRASKAPPAQSYARAAVSMLLTLLRGG